MASSSGNTLVKIVPEIGLLRLFEMGMPLYYQKTVAEGIFSSLLVYCLPLFGGLDKGQLNQLQMMQNKAA